jgi:lipoprotein-anchoring transpeptidase ErfK/SrfK
MRVQKLIVGMTLVGTAVLSACGGGASAVGSGPTTTTEPSTTTTTVDPTTTTPPPPPSTTTTTKTTPKPTTSKPKPKPKPAPAPVAGVPCKISTGACIDLSANKSWLLENGKVIYGPVSITHGRKGYRTPPGTFRVSFKDIDHKSSIFNNAPMPYSVFFNGGIAFHEGSLRELSHGCIHLSRAAAKTYYNALQVGETVQVVP